MRVSTLKLSAAALLAATTLLAAPAAMAVDLDVALLAGKGGGGKPGGGGGGGGGDTNTLTAGKSNCTQTAVIGGDTCWMAQGLRDYLGASSTDNYRGQGVNLWVVDDFSSTNTFSGTWGGAIISQTHGEWTFSETRAVAPGASGAEKYQWDWNSAAAPTFTPPTFVDGEMTAGNLDVVNASYGIVGPSIMYYPGVLASKPIESVLIDAARNGDAIIVKAAGNDGVEVGTSAKGKLDYFSKELIGAQTAIFVGALDFNGTGKFGTQAGSNFAKLSSYSNFPGSNLTVQDQFLVVGVDYLATDLPGTSFAAPIVSGYAAILGSKFGTFDETQITSRLLDHATYNGLLDLGAPGWGDEDKAAYGRGQACLPCSLAPDAILNP